MIFDNWLLFIEIFILVECVYFDDFVVVVEWLIQFYQWVLFFLLDCFVEMLEGVMFCVRYWVFYLEVWMIVFSYFKIDLCLFFGYVVIFGIYVSFIIWFDLFCGYLIEQIGLVMKNYNILVVVGDSDMLMLVYFVVVM